MWTLTDAVPSGMSIYDYPASAGQVVSNAFDEALETNPVPLFMMSREFHGAKSIGPTLLKADAEAEAERRGVKVKIPEDGITKNALDILVSRKQDEAARQMLYARREGFMASAGMFSAGMAGTLMDPVNAAAGFIPVLSGTRYAAGLAKAATASSRLAWRLGVGGAEGVVGAAAVELPTIALRRDLDDDYGLYDSLVNVAFGSFASAGIRVGAGALRDRWMGLKAARQEDFFRSVEPERWNAMRVEYERQIERDMDAELRAGFDVSAGSEGGVPRFGIQEASPDAKSGLDAEGNFTLFHGTTATNARAILSGGFQKSDPVSVATMVEEKLGLPKGSVLNDPNYQFARGRTDLDEAHFSTDYNVAKSYTTPEQISDALRAAFFVSHPKMNDRPHSEVQPVYKKWYESQIEKFVEDRKVLQVTVPWSIMEKHGFGREISLREFRALLKEYGNLGKDNYSFPIESLGGLPRVVSDSTHAQALKTAVAQAAEGQRINVDPVLKQDPVFGAQRMPMADVKAAAEVAGSPENKSAASPEASARADATLKAEAPAATGRAEPPPPRGAAGEAGAEAPKDPELAALEKGLADAKKALDEQMKAQGIEPPKAKDGERDNMQRAQDYEAALNSFASCVKGKS